MDPKLKQIYQSKGQDANFRRKWVAPEQNEETEEKERQQRIKEEQEQLKIIDAPKKTIEANESYRLNIQSRIGKTSFVASVKEAGFTCEACHYTVKDSASYYEHLTTRRHLMNARVALPTGKATAEKVKERLASLKRKTEETIHFDVAHHLSTRQHEEDQRERERQARKKEKRHRHKEHHGLFSKSTQEGLDDVENGVHVENREQDRAQEHELEQMRQLMGFGKFTSSHPS